uniref:Core-binding (CB) domain-containing protein n=1 Tax=Xenopus tropicalis TaxID=8364 RepID=A0A803JVC7_XENTR
MLPKPFPTALEQGSLEPVTIHPGNQTGTSITKVVDLPTQPNQGQEMDPTTVDSHHYGRKPHGLGRGFSPAHVSRDMDGRGGKTANQRPGDQGHTKRHLSLVPTSQRPSSSRTVGQRHCCCLHQQAGRHPQQPSHAGGVQDTRLGGITRTGTVSGLHTRRPELGGGLPQSPTDRSGRVGTSPRHLRPDCGQVGMPGHRHASIQAQLQSSYVLRQVTGPGGIIRGCLSHTMDLQQSLCLSSTGPLTSDNTQDPTGTYVDNSNCPRLAQADLVCGSCDNVDCSTVTVTAQAGFTDTGSNQTREPGNVAFNGLAVETDLWRAKGFSTSAIDILLKARKPTTTKVYYRTWRAFMNHCASTHMPWKRASTQTVIEFLAKGFHLGLSLATLKSQISALSLLLQHQWTRESDIVQFLQGVALLINTLSHLRILHFIYIFV